jgi:hypothetical protein
MRNAALRLMFTALVALSVGAVGAAFVQTAAAAPETPNCPSACNEPQGNCAGTTCTCKYNGNTGGHSCEAGGSE